MTVMYIDLNRCNDCDNSGYNENLSVLKDGPDFSGFFPCH